MVVTAVLPGSDKPERTLWDLPTQWVPITVAVSGAEACELFAPLAEHMIAVEPNAELAAMWHAARPGGGYRQAKTPSTTHGSPRVAE